MAWAGRHLSWLFWACAAVLSPWVVFLYLTQAPRARAHGAQPTAAGLMLIIIVGTLLTAWTYRRSSPLSAVAASFTATTVFIMAWFRILTQLGGGQHRYGLIPVFLAVVAILIGLCVVVVRSDLSARAPARWLPIALAVAALALVPFLVLRLSVPQTAQIAHHLKIAWTGLDVFEVVALAATGFALQHRPALVAVPATVTGALLSCDAWINIVPASGAAFHEAIAMAFVEIPLAALGLWVATRHPVPAAVRGTARAGSA